MFSQSETPLSKAQVGRNKTSWREIAAILCAIFLFGGCSHPSNPDETVRRAYSWYAKVLKLGENPLARKKREMAPFATAALLASIDNLREEMGDHPFARSRRFDGRLHVEDMVVNGSTAVARITVAGRAIGIHQLAIRLTQEEAVWKIDDVKLLDDL